MATSDSGWAYSDDDDYSGEEYDEDLFVDDDEDEEILQEMIDKYFGGLSKNKIMIALKDHYPDYF